MPWPFSKKKKEENPWNPDQNQVVKEKTKNRRFSFPSISLGNPFKKKYRFGIMLKLKRLIAGLLWIVNIITGFSSIQEPASLIFLLTSFILLDYLWKTRKSKVKMFNS